MSVSREFAFQLDMFSGDLVDNRTPKQKQQAQERSQPKQAEMFSQREMAQFGVTAHPKLSLSPKTRLELVMQDPRTDEEKEQDLQRQIEQHTYPLPIWEVEPGQKTDDPLAEDSQSHPENGGKAGNGSTSCI